MNAIQIILHNRKHLHYALAIITLIAGSSPAFSQPKLDTAFVSRQLDAAARQIKVLAEKSSKDKFPRTFQNARNEESDSGWWTSGFYPGTLLYLYEHSGDSELLRLAEQKLALLEKEKFNKTTHDLGFMLHCSFGNAMRIKGDTAAYQEIVRTGAESLASRYNDVTKTIRSWDFDNFPVIIDNMMNLEFLFSASRLSGNKAYHDIAISHANTTMKNHYRKDMSSYHVVDYDPSTGAVIKRKTNQGAFDESSWARGQAWGLYGYAMMYQETGNKRYLAFAKKVAGYMLNHPQMPEDLIPYWDYDAPDLPEGHKYAKYRFHKDASAAAVTASALLKMSTQVKGKLGTSYLEKAETILKTLASPEYTADHGSNGGYILMHSVGNVPQASEIDVPLTYADYYYVEALMLYKDLLKRASVRDKTQ